jgi:IS30 family transposase
VARGRPLELLEREMIASGVEWGLSCAEVGRRIGRDRSVVSREIARNGGREHYWSLRAQRWANQLRKRPKGRKILTSPKLAAAVQAGLRQKWSPKQIAQRLRLEHPEDDSWWVSHETIYQTLFIQAKGALRKQVREGLRQGRIQRRPRSRASTLRGRIKDMVLISERPPEAEDRAVPGFWEGDLIIGKDHVSQIATLVERQTRFVLGECTRNIEHGTIRDHVESLVA